MVPVSIAYSTSIQPKTPQEHCKNVIISVSESNPCCHMGIQLISDTYGWCYSNVKTNSPIPPHYNYRNGVMPRQSEILHKTVK